MSGPRARALRQMAVAALLGVLVLVPSVSGAALLGLLSLLVMAIAWPPQVAWSPLAMRSVLLRYVPFAACWYGFVFGYLRVMHGLGYPVAPQPMLQELASGHATFALVLAVVVLAPLLEELLFRGYLFTGLAAAGLPMWAVQVATAALFGAVHGVDYALPIGVLALLFGWLRARHRALLPCILAHTVHNGLTVAVTILWPGHLDWLYPR